MGGGGYQHDDGDINGVNNGDSMYYGLDDGRREEGNEEIGS